MRKISFLCLLLASFGASAASAQTGITVSVGSGGWNQNSVQWGVSVGSGYPLYQNVPVYQNYPVYSNVPVYNSYPVNVPVYQSYPIYPNLNNYNPGCGQPGYRQAFPAPYGRGHGRRHCR
jgi:hypothetical protein